MSDDYRFPNYDHYRELCLQTYNRMKTQVGHDRKKLKDRRTLAFVALEFLLDHNLHIDPHLESNAMKENGFLDLHEWIAYQRVLLPNLKMVKPERLDHRIRFCGLREKEDGPWIIGNIKMRAYVFRTAFRSLREILVDDHRILVFLAPRTSKQSDVSVITLHGDYQVNTRETARDIHRIRDVITVGGSIKARANRREAVDGVEGRNQLLDQYKGLIDEAERADPILPKMKQLKMFEYNPEIGLILPTTIPPATAAPTLEGP